MIALGFVNRRPKFNPRRRSEWLPCWPVSVLTIHSSKARANRLPTSTWCRRRCRAAGNDELGKSTELGLDIGRQGRIARKRRAMDRRRNQIHYRRNTPETEP